MLKLQDQLFILHKVMKVHINLKCFIVNCKEKGCTVLESTTKSLLEQEEQGLSTLENNIDEIIYERLSMPNTCSFIYLSTVYDCIEQEKELTINKKNINLQNFLKVLAGLIINYSYSCLKIGDNIFPHSLPKSSLKGVEYSVNKLVYFLEKTENFAFLKKICEGNLHNDLDFLNEFSQVINTYIEYKLDELSVVDSLSTVYAKIIIKLIEIGIIQPNELRNNLSIEEWNPFGIEKNNLIGVILNVSCLPKRNSLILVSTQPEDKIRDFINKSSEKEKAEALKILRNKHENFISACSDVLKYLLKYYQPQTLFFIRKIISLNFVKSKYEIATRINANFNQFSDNFCANLLDFLLDLTDPIAKKDNPRLEKVLNNHLKFDGELKILLKTAIVPLKKLLFTPKEIEGTISHYFYCTLFMLRFGWTTLKKYVKFLNNSYIDYLSKGNLVQANYIKTIIDVYIALLVDDKRNFKIFNFYLIFCELLQKWNGFTVQLPIEQPDECLNYIPEYILKDFAGFIIYLLDNNKLLIFPQSASSPVNRLLTFITFMISSPSLFPNFKLINKFVIALNKLFKYKILSSYSDLLKSNEVVKNYLILSILRYYSDLETYQFYGDASSKIRFRRNTCLLIKKLLTHNTLSTQITKIQKEEIFNKFLNYLLDEITFSCENGFRNTEDYKELLEKFQADKSLEESLNNKKILCTILWKHVNTNLSLLLKFTEMQLGILCSDVFGKRFAAFLNQFLFTLNGPKCLKIKLNNPEAILFKPKKSLESLIIIYVNLSNFPEFFSHIINDTRFFSISIFEKTKNLLQSKAKMDLNYVSKFTGLVDELIKVSNQTMIRYEDAPDEFLCQLTMELMKNPVKLPSGVVVDRSSIERHLLTSNNDPFTKMKLKIEEVEDVSELKEKIQLWINSKINKSL